MTPEQQLQLSSNIIKEICLKAQMAKQIIDELETNGQFDEEGLQMVISAEGEESMAEDFRLLLGSIASLAEEGLKRGI